MIDLAGAVNGLASLPYAYDAHVGSKRGILCILNLHEESNSNILREGQTCPFFL